MVFNKSSLVTLLACGFALTSCQTPSPQAQLSTKAPLSSLNAKREIPPAILQIVQLLKEEKFTEASQIINIALQAQPKNVVLHILNGLTYEKMAETGDSSTNELAVIGYQNAINIDPSNVFAIAQLGKLKYRQQAYDQAQEYFANALLLKSNDADLWHELAAASYYAYDIKTALSAINKAEKLKPGDPLIHRSATMIYAALGDFSTAKKHFEFFQKRAGADPAVDFVASRFNDWQSLYKSGRITLAASTTPSSTPPSSPPSSTPATPLAPGAPPSPPPPSGPSGSTPETSAEPSPVEGSPYQIATESAANEVLKKSLADQVLEEPHPPGGEPGPGAEKMPKSNPQIVIDVYHLRITETASTSKGNNILDNLAVTLNPGNYNKFKASLWGSGAPPLDIRQLSTSDTVLTSADTGFKANQVNNAGANPEFTPGTTAFTLANTGSLSGHIFTSGITWAGLTYSLNIANAADKRTEVVSRPSLMTFLKKPSVFFSGDELINGFTGQYGGTLVRYPVGMTLEITPETLEGDILSLTIGVEGSILTAPNPNLAQTVDVGKTRIDTFVKLRLGETLMLGGIYERSEVSSKEGFPGLMDVPVVQYFFSNEQTASNRTSIVFLITPRSPDAVKAAVYRAMTREAVEPHLSELVTRNQDWFSTHANLVPVFSYLSKNPLVYYEFRSGDILPPSWGWDITVPSKLQQLESFLYF